MRFCVPFACVIALAVCGIAGRTVHAQPGPAAPSKAAVVQVQSTQPALSGCTPAPGRGGFAPTSRFRVLVANFEGKHATQGFEASLASVIQSTLLQHLSGLLAGSERGNPELSEVDALSVQCAVSSHEAAQDVGRAWHADLVLWGKVEQQMDATAQELSQIFHRGFRANNASRNTIQAGANANVHIEAQQTLNIHLSRELAGLSLKTSMTPIGWRGAALGTSRNLQLSHLQIPSTLDFPALGSRWPLALFHVLLGIYAAHEERFELAAQQFEEAQAQLSSTSHGTAEIYWLTGTNRMLSGWLPAGRAAFEQGRKLCPNADSGCMAEALARQAWGYQQQREPERAIEHYRQSLMLSKLVAPTDRTVETLAAMGRIYDEQGDVAQATQHFEQLAALLPQIRQVSARAHAHIHMAEFQTNRGRLRDALNLYAQALTLSRQTIDTIGQIIALNNQGVLYEELHQFEAARAAYAAAMVVSADSSDSADPIGQATLLQNVGRVALALQDRQGAQDAFARAEQLLSRALRLRRQAHDLRGEIAALQRLSTLQSDAGALSNAIELAMRAQDVAERIGDRTAQSLSLQLAARSLLKVHEGKTALEQIKRGIALFAGPDKSKTRVVLLKDLGDVLAELRDWQAAEDAYRQALELIKGTEYRLPHMGVLTALAQAKQGGRKYQESLHIYEQVQQRAKEYGDTHSVLNASVALVSLYAQSGDLRNAMRASHEAVILSQQARDIPMQFVAISNMARMYLRVGEKRHALESYGRVLALANRQGDVARRAAALSMTGWLRCSLGQATEGLADILQARNDGAELGSSFVRTLWLTEAGCWLRQGEKAKSAQALNLAHRLSTPLLGDLQSADPKPTKETKARSANLDEQAPLNISALWRADRLAELGDTYIEQQQGERARELYRESLATSAELAEPCHEAQARERLARLSALAGSTPQAAEEHQPVLAFYEKVGDVAHLASFLFAVGKLRASSGHADQALEFLRLASQRAAQADLLELQMNALVELGKARTATLAFSEAMASYQDALILAKKLGDARQEEAIEQRIREAKGGIIKYWINKGREEQK